MDDLESFQTHDVRVRLYKDFFSSNSMVALRGYHLKMLSFFRNSLPSIVPCLLLVQCSLASKPCNGFVDNVLNQLKLDKEIFHDPYEISSKENSFGMYNVESGFVYGLNTLHRDGDVVPFKRGGSTHLKVHLAIGEIHFQCNLKRKIFHIGKPIQVKADIPYIVMEIQVSPEADGSKPKISSFNIDEVKGLKVKVANLGPITNVLYSAFLRLLTTFFKRMIRSGIQDRLSKFLQDKVADFKIPEECMKDAYD